MGGGLTCWWHPSKLDDTLFGTQIRIVAPAATPAADKASANNFLKREKERGEENKNKNENAEIDDG